MSVIIDEFEVIVDSQQGSETENNNEAESSAATNSLKPHDITSVQEQHLLRCERVRAH